MKNISDHLFGNLWLNLARADCSENLSGSRYQSHINPVIAKIHNTEANDLAPQDAMSWLDQRLPGKPLLIHVWFPHTRGAVITSSGISQENLLQTALPFAGFSSCSHCFHARTCSNIINKVTLDTGAFRCLLTKRKPTFINQINSRIIDLKYPNNKNTRFIYHELIRQGAKVIRSPLRQLERSRFQPQAAWVICREKEGRSALDSTHRSEKSSL